MLNIKNMKRYSPILFIWIFCLIFLIVLVFTSYKSGFFIETIAWTTATLFLSNLILYHLNVTKDENDDIQILDDNR